MNKIVTIVGARPQFIKCKLISEKIRKEYSEILVHTGQHYDENMSKSFFDLLEIPEPDENLGIGSGSHAKQTAHMMISIETVLNKYKPDMVIIYGDTNSTLAGALVAAKMFIPVAHVEAGLRSFDKRMPEELNRICADHYSDLLFCPGEGAITNLKNENISGHIYDVGDIMKDVLLNYSNKIDAKETLLKFNGIVKDKFYFLTIHRQENTDNIERLESIINILKEAKHPVVFAAHPRTRKIIEKNFKKSLHNISIIDPVNYLESIAFQKESEIVLTDSGGIQKEAYYLKKPCITFRNSTEWIELIETKHNVLVDADIDKFREAESMLLNKPAADYDNSLYGDGKAADKIVNHIKEYLH